MSTFAEAATASMERVAIRTKQTKVRVINFFMYFFSPDVSSSPWLCFSFYGGGLEG
jgi:hypothetical protein